MPTTTIQTSDGCTIAVDSSGLPTGPTVVFSHFLGGSKKLFQSQAQALGNRFRVLAYDSRGHGASAAPAGPYSIELLGRDALAVIAAFKLDRVHFVGVSQGGMTGMWLASHHPEKVDRLVVANSTPFIPNKPIWDELAARALREGMDGIASAMIAGWLSAGFKAREPARTSEVVDEMRRMSAAGFAANCAVLRDVDLRTELPRIAAPTLVIAGADDGPRGAAAPVVASSVQRGTLAIIPEAAHLSHIENPADFNQRIAEFLS
jgi:3-oxoadipate enol-lactonase